jgi:tRNA dimethylallyltransferase
VALALAQQIPLEIISVDSALVYRGMDIGTAKPEAAERAAVPHHLIDICDPVEPYSAARFATQARQLAALIRSRGKLPLLVGGTMLYFKALREGLSDMPGADLATRRQIDQEAAQRGWPALHAELALVDPSTAARLASADAQRIQRALEVWRLSGQTLSTWHQIAPADAPAAGAWPLLSLEPVSRAWLHARVAQRWQQMMDQGFLDEVIRLRSRPDLHAALPALRSVGYRQAWQALEAVVQQGGDPALLRLQPAWQQAAIAATRQLAKRQLTWLRSVADRHIVPGDAERVTQDCLLWAQRSWNPTGWAP